MASNGHSPLELYVWPGDFGLASVDIFCLQALVASKIAATPIQCYSSTKTGQSPTGSFPMLVNGDTKLVKVDEICDHLRNMKQDVVLDGQLTPSQRVEYFSYSAYLRAHLYPAMLHSLWVDNYNYNTLTQAWYSTKLGFPWNLFYLEKRRRYATNYLKALGKTETELIRDALSTLNNLSSKLGDNKYFCGDKPSSVDAIIFGYLAVILKLPVPSDRIQVHLSSLPNLVRFVESIICIYLPLSEEQKSQHIHDKVYWEKRKVRAQKEAEENRLRKEQKRTEAEEAGKSSLRDTIIFGVGALSLSVLFALHTGIISVIREDDIIDAD